MRSPNVDLSLVLISKSYTTMLACSLCSRVGVVVCGDAGDDGYLLLLLVVHQLRWLRHEFQVSESGVARGSSAA